MNIFWYSLKRKLIILAKFVFEFFGIFNRQPDIRSRAIFVVGCSHSGTTLLATVLGRHSKILAIGDETYIFGQNYIHATSAIRQWDILCRQFGKHFFLEKTPKHIYEIGKIFRILPDARILYIARNPVDNIASLCKRNKDFKKSLNKWIGTNRYGTRYVDDPRVNLCLYDELVADPSGVVGSICQFLGIEYEDQMISGSESIYDHWKGSEAGNLRLRQKQVTRQIEDNRGKGRTFFREEELQLIKQKTQSLSDRLGVPV